MKQYLFALRVVRLPGFEPGLEAWKASILNQSRPQPHGRVHVVGLTEAELRVSMVLGFCV